MKYITVKSCFILCASMMITPFLQGMEAVPQALTEGLSGWLYTQSWVLSKPQLLLYAFQHNLFDHKNKDHKKLVQEALLCCRQNKDTENIGKILTLIDKKFSDIRILRTKTSRAAHDFLTTQQIGDNLATHQLLSTVQKNQLSQMSGFLDKIKGTIIILTGTLNRYKDIQEEYLKTFRADYRKRRELTFLLHNLNPGMDENEALDNCSDREDDALVDPALRDDAYINKKVMKHDNQFGKDNVLFLSLLSKLEEMETSTNQLLALCGQDKW